MKRMDRMKDQEDGARQFQVSIVLISGLASYRSVQLEAIPAWFQALCFPPALRSPELNGSLWLFDVAAPTEQVKTSATVESWL